MARTTASDYVRQYHDLAVTAVGPTGAWVSDTVRITKYQVVAADERSKLLNALKKALGLKYLPNLATTTDSFQFPMGDVMGGVEWFYWQGIRRAFHFKASPAEMIDVLRLAVRCGRIGTGKDIAGVPAAALTMGQYGNRFFGQDCNGLVGNYYNLSPALYIGCYAEMSAREEERVAKKVEASKGYWNGWARAEVLSLPHIPLAPRRSAEEARSGDVLVDVQSGTSWAHIAVVEDVAVVDKETVTWRVVEWGQETAEKNIGTDKDAHIKPIKTVKLKKGPKKNLGVGHESMNGLRFRYLFAGPQVPWDVARWGRGGDEGA
ncbi:MAG: hypothetical protein K2W96_05100 [Gemmataceae bacterium]|nr:hypothetical protein [Gemmataceae bacterium]